MKTDTIKIIETAAVGGELLDALSVLVWWKLNSRKKLTDGQRESIAALIRKSSVEKSRVLWIDIADEIEENKISSATMVRMVKDWLAEEEFASITALQTKHKGTNKITFLKHWLKLFVLTTKPENQDIIQASKDWFAKMGKSVSGRKEVKNLWEKGDTSALEAIKPPARKRVSTINRKTTSSPRKPGKKPLPKNKREGNNIQDLINNEKEAKKSLFTTAGKLKPRMEGTPKYIKWRSIHNRLRNEARKITETDILSTSPKTTKAVDAAIKSKFGVNLIHPNLIKRTSYLSYNKLPGSKNSIIWSNDEKTVGAADHQGWRHITPYIELLEYPPNSKISKALYRYKNRAANKTWDVVLSMKDRDSKVEVKANTLDPILDSPLPYIKHWRKWLDDDDLHLRMFGAVCEIMYHTGLRVGTATKTKITSTGAGTLRLEHIDAVDGKSISINSTRGVQSLKARIKENEPTRYSVSGIQKSKPFEIDINPLKYSSDRMSKTAIKKVVEIMTESIKRKGVDSHKSCIFTTTSKIIKAPGVPWGSNQITQSGTNLLKGNLKPHDFRRLKANIRFRELISKNKSKLKNLDSEKALAILYEFADTVALEIGHTKVQRGRKKADGSMGPGIALPNSATTLKSYINHSTADKFYDLCPKAGGIPDELLQILQRGAGKPKTQRASTEQVTEEPVENILGSVEIEITDTVPVLTDIVTVQESIELVAA